MLALAFPFMVNAYWLSVGVLAMFYAIVTASWALLAGYAGQFSFGHMAFVSLGAYTSGLLVKWFDIPIPLGMVAGVLMCAIVGSGIGFVCLRMRGPYLALFTVAFSEVLRIVIVSENEVTGGSGGLEVTPLFHGRTDTPFYYLGLALLIGSLAIMQFLVTSRWGLFFRAIRENEDAAAASGVKVVRYRILAFAITSSFSVSPPKPAKKSSTQRTNRSASAVSTPITARNASVGNRRANSLTKLQLPARAVFSTSVRHSSRIIGSASSIARGENQGLRIRRYLM